MGDGKNERERETREKPPTAIEDRCGEKGFSMSGSGGMDETETGGEPEQPPKRRRGRIFYEIRDALEHLAK